jgi:hypothetical protein
VTGGGPPGNGKGNGNNGGHHHAKDRSAVARAHALLLRAQRDFAAADRAYADGKGAEWVRLTHRARAEVARALNLLP